MIIIFIHILHCIKYLKHLLFIVRNMSKKFKHSKQECLLARFFFLIFFFLLQTFAGKIKNFSLLTSKLDFMIYDLKKKKIYDYDPLTHLDYFKYANLWSKNYAVNFLLWTSSIIKEVP